jgi:tetratricopeptide (TPR) repeat protein
LANTVGGTLATAAGQTTIAADYWQRAVAIEPTAVEAHTQLALVLELQQQPLEALMHYQTASRLNPLDENSRQGLARLQITTVSPETTATTLAGVANESAPFSDPLPKKPSKKNPRPLTRIPLRFQRPPAFDAGGFRPF